MDASPESSATKAGLGAAGPVPDGGARWSEFFPLLWRGTGMGVAEVIPGVSGGTVALITGVLDRIVRAIHSVDAVAIGQLLALRIRAFMSRVHWRFLLMLFSGQLLGVLLCTRVIPLPRLVREFPEPTMGLFFGLIAASAVLLCRDGGRPGLRGALAYLAGGLLGLAVVAGFRAETPDAPWFIFICGAVAICAWILPGVSGSFVLLLLRKYDYVWEAVTLGNDQPVLHNVLHVTLPLGAGALVGLALFARLLDWMIKRQPRLTLHAMTGLLFASLWAVFPFQHPTYEVTARGMEKLVATRPYLPSLEHLSTSQGMLAVMLMAGGFVLVLLADRQARKRRRGTAAASPSRADRGFTEPG